MQIEGREEKDGGETRVPGEGMQGKVPRILEGPGYDLRTGGANFRRVVLQQANLVGACQLPVTNLGLDPIPTLGGSASAVLIFFMATPPVAPAVVELLLPITAALSRNFTGENGGEMRAGEVRREEDDGGGVG
jgi:hypothetical protein